jgi:hypothetical protein
MPTVVRLGNVKIVIYAADHNPPHFHLLSAEHAAIVSIETLEITSGFVPRQVYEVATRWAVDHMDLLRETWTRLNERD